MTLDDYEQVDKGLQGLDARSCSVCSLKCQDTFARKEHEKNVHEGLGKRFKCDKCEKSFSNSNALEYHQRKHNPLPPVYCCDLCGKEFSAENTLERHQQVRHCEGPEKSKNVCHKCGVSFSRLDALIRHNKEKHFAQNVNVDFVEDLDSLTVIYCDKCDKQFKRKDDLKRHNMRAHSEDGNQLSFKCSQCSKNFSRKSALNRHVKLKH